MQSKSMIRLSVVLTALSLSIAVQAQELNAFSVQQCVDYAKKNSVQVKNALLDIRIQEETNREFTAAAYPRVGASLGANYFPQVATQVFPNFIALGTYGVLQKEGVKDGNGNAIQIPTDIGFINAQFGTKYSASLGFEVSQLLFDGQVFVGLQARAAAVELAQKGAEVTEENIKANIHKIYFQLVAARKQVAALDANIDKLTKLQKDTRELFKNGFAEKLDIDKLDVTLINLQTEKQKVLNQIESGNLGLKMLMGMPVAQTLLLTDTLADNQLKADLLEASYNASDRKDIQQLEILKKLGGYNVKRYQLAKLPTVALFGSFSTNAQRNSFNFFKTSEKWFPTSLIGFKITAPIFQGFGRNASINKARYDLEKYTNNMELLKMSIDHDVEQARIRYKNAIITMDYQKKNMQLAENVYSVTKIKYEQGLGSNMEITNAQTELRLAQTNYFSALYDAIIARVDYQKAIGKL